jgi:tetratricopeptide (TPR) repeat protein
VPIEEVLAGIDLQEEAWASYRRGHYRYAIGIATELIDTTPGGLRAMYTLRAHSYRRLGDFEDAIRDLQRAAEMPPDESDPTGAATYNYLCWYLAITNRALRALPHCEEAVRLDPRIYHYDSRGFVYAMLGRTEAAIADFSRVIEEIESTSGSSLREWREIRQRWVAQLMAGDDIATRELLEDLRADGTDPNAREDPDILDVDGYTRARFQRVLGGLGFAHRGLVEDSRGTIVDQHLFVFDDGCRFAVYLSGPGTGLLGVTMDLVACSEGQVYLGALTFQQMLIQENPHEEEVDSVEMGQGYVWLMQDVRAVFAGDVDETAAREIHGIAFSSEAVEYEEFGSGVRLIARR